MSEESVRILKTGECPSLSGRSTLTYEIGCKDEEIYLRLAGNTGQGIFNKNWIPLAQLLGSEEITPGLLKTMFQGKSANSAGFFMAVLLREGLMKTSEGNLRQYERNDPGEFVKNIQVLMQSKVSPESAQRSQPKTAKKRKTEAL